MPTALSKIAPFHLAAPIKDKAVVRQFYENILGCSIGREAENWIDINFFGHQLSFHVKPAALESSEPKTQVDGKAVPVRHFGVILEWEDWNSLAERLKSTQTEFVIEPYIRFEGKVGEQATMFFLDPTGHALEFKAFKNEAQIFAT